ncbi:KdsC family phosphatase [Algivirga pacifica]|uniref:3-deoxy-D-manno-octulosonate 8-phosphate phosphatase n=1 Tax=Algivirga pacifica TaxID=1162670 RepID=A0ABP9D8W3_9BACT
MKQSISEKLKKIKAIAFDIDGVLTDGKVIYLQEAQPESTSTTKEIKNFNVKDGFIIVQMKKMGFIVGAITGRNSAVVRHRSKELNLSFHYHGSKRKTTHYEEIKKQFNLKDEEIAYLGDDIPDLGILTKCGLSCSPADAPAYVRHRVDYVTQAVGGEGVLREIGDMILIAQGKMDQLIEQYIHE